MLARLNPNSRDKSITFKEKNHIYTYIPTNAEFLSVTTIIHKYFPEFVGDEVINKMMNSQRWPQSKYYGMTKEQIKKQWEDIRKEAANLGTQMHAAIEQYFNGELKEQPQTPEFQMFLHFWKNFSQINPSYRPYRTEWIIYDETSEIAGSIDFVLVNDKGELILLDWKRSKEIKKENKYQKGFHPIAHLEDCNFNHYSLQLNFYRHILETRYSKTVLAMFIVVFHPNLTDCQFIHIAENRKDTTNIWDDFLRTGKAQQIRDSRRTVIKDHGS